MDRMPKPNVQFLSWFFGEYKKGTLNLDPKYQRNPIWSIGQKCFLIDSIISGCPIPQIYINVKTIGKSSDRKTIYEVVDGQQRLRSILEFMADDWKLVKTAAAAYPVSEYYKPHIGKKYSELPDKVQEAIWNYPLAVQELRGWDDKEIRSLFRRLNYVVERLNKQELRHSQYFGQFMESVDSLAKNSFWDETDFFSRKDSQRMKDVEFVSELLVVIIDGVQDQQRTLDEYYAGYDVKFPNRAKYIAIFQSVLDSLLTIKDIIIDSRFSKKADFYGLFSAVSKIIKEHPNVNNLLPAKNALNRLSRELEKQPEQLKGVYEIYHQTVIEGPNKLAKRKQRIEILEDILRRNLQI